MLGRLGVLRLREYGLVLTPEDRVLSIRPTTLDDGLGGRIVGWRDNDLAPAELQTYGAPRVPAKRPQFPSAAYLIVPQPAPVAPAQGIPTFAPGPVAAPIQPAAPAIPVAAATRIARPAVVTPPPVAAAPVVEEDDWEWTIAIARARAAAEWAEEGAAAAASEATAEHTQVEAFTQFAALPVAAPRRRQPTMPPPLTISTPAQPMRTLPRIDVRPTVSRTVIPVPALPTSALRNFAPVVRAPGAPTVRQMPHPIPPTQPRRFAKGTGPMLPTTKALSVGDDTVPNLNIGDETVPAMYAAPAARATLPRIVARK
ncbi:hypothetical protein BH11MYX2_BH11MYX2_24390 [soil metagenome]